jgi:hypothetical protein
MNGLGRAILFLGLVGVVPIGCGGLTPIPSGAQQVHITDTETSVHAEPATVHAGDVYVVLDGPRQNVVFVARKRTAEATPGPMSDEDLDRLVHGDTEGTSIEGISVGGSAEQRAAGRGQIGFGGNVYKFVLSAGKYAFLLDPPDGVVAPPGTMMILEVTP